MVMYNEIDPTAIVADKIVVNETGTGTFVKLCYGASREPLVFQTPLLTLPFDVLM